MTSLLTSGDSSARKGTDLVVNHRWTGHEDAVLEMGVLAKTVGRTLKPDFQLQRKRCIHQNDSWYSLLLLLCFKRKVEAVGWLKEWVQNILGEEALYLG